jgi:hypothetical protein
MYKIKFLLIVSLISLIVNNIYSQVQKISYRGYTDCYKIANDSVEVIIVAQSGARVLRYALNGVNMIFEDPAIDGKTLTDFLSKTFAPDGGRFDFRGAANLGNNRDTLWVGPYTTEITGEYSVKMTSMVDHNMGINISREFSLDPASSRLKIRQIMTNKSTINRTWYFWGRTFSPYGGKVVIPVNPNSKFQSKWGYYEGSTFISTNASDSNVQIIDSLFTLRAEHTAARKRYAMDAKQGWILYGNNAVLFMMKFEIDLSKSYLTESGETIIIFTDGERLVELEPTSPAKLMVPGDSLVFKEEWWLFSYPDATINLNPNEAARYALEKSTSSPVSNKPSKNPDPNVHLFPNPVNDYMTISGKNILYAELYSLAGNKIYTANNVHPGNDLSFHTKAIPEGFYVVKIFMEEVPGYVCRKIFKSSPNISSLTGL